MNILNKKTIFKIIIITFIVLFGVISVQFIKTMILRQCCDDTIVYKVLDFSFVKNKNRNKSDQIIAEGKMIIQDLEISGDGIGILVKEGAEVIIKNVYLHDNIKGIYIEKGAKVKIINSIIENNDEEGIDIREFTNVQIKDNIIRKNGESGIEMESEEVRIYVIRNEIIENESKGVAVQYRRGKGGKLFLISNNIKNNREQDMFCSNTTGAVKTPENFYCDFITLYGDTGKIKGCKWTQCKKIMIAL